MDAYELLRAAGWRPGRHVDASAGIAALTEKGLTVTPSAVALLEEFSGLTMYEPGNPNPLVIDGAVAARDSELAWSDSYAAAIGLPVTPIGEYSNLLFWVDSEGVIWATFDNDLGRAGSSLPAMIQGLYFEDPGWQLDHSVE